MKKSINYSLLACVLAVVIVSVLQVVIYLKKNTVYIAVCGPMSGDGEINGTAMLRGINLYLDKSNRKGDLNDLQVKLKIVDDQNSGDVAQKNAQQMATDDNILLVLGHYNSETSLAAGSIYEKYGIPAITASATADAITPENDYYYRIIPNNNFQGNYIAHYIHKALEKKSVSIILDSDSYGTGLVSHFETTARKLGLEIKKKWSFDANDNVLDQRLEEIAREIRTSDQPDIIFVATHAPEGAKIMTKLKYPGTDFSIIGPDSFGGKQFLTEINKFPQEQTIPGYYSNDVYAMSPYIQDVANEEAQLFRDEYVKSYKTEPSWISINYYDAMLLALDAIKRAQISGKPLDIKADRKKIKNFLGRLYKRESAVQGVNGDIYFDVNGDIIKPLSVGIYKNQRLISNLTQYQIVEDLKSVDNILKKILEGDMIKISRNFLKKVQVVYTGIDINEITNLDMEEQTYTMDFYLWFRYQGELDDTNIEFINSLRAIQPEKPVRVEKTDNVITRAYRIKEDFKSDFNFSDYPFDKHILSIKFRHRNLTRDKLIYIPDFLGMRQTGMEGSSDYPDITGWITSNVIFFQDIIRNRSTLGVPRFFNSLNTIQYSKYNANVWVERITGSFIIKNFLPVFIMILISYVIYFLPIDPLQPRLYLGMSALMTTTLFHLKLSASIEVGYVVAMENVFFMEYALAALAILVSLYINHQNRLYVKLEKENASEIALQEKESNIKIASLFGRIAHPFVVIVVAAVILLTYAK